MATAYNRILAPYTRRTEGWRHDVRRLLAVGAIAFVAMIMGFFVAVLPLGLMAVPFLPILLLAGLVLWAAPDIDPALDRPIRWTFAFLILAMFAWPAYLAIDVPGLGWINFGRLALFALLGMGLWSFFTSARIRRETAQVLNAFPPALWMFIGFLILQLALAVVTNSFSSRWTIAQIQWYYLFFLAAWVYVQPGMLVRTFRLLLIAAAIIGYFGAVEYAREAPMWAGRIPSFLQISNEALIARVMNPSFRFSDGLYRAGSVFLTSVTYAEFLSLCYPFVFYAMFTGKTLWRRLAAVALLSLLISNAFFTNARTAMVGLLLTAIAYLFLWAARRYRRFFATRELIGPAAFWSFPALFAASVIAVLSIGRLRTRVLGGGAHQASNDARAAQWDITVARLGDNPFGYGPFRSGEVMDYRNPAGVLTIDGYHMNLLLDYGILGFLLLLGFAVSCTMVAAWVYFRSDKGEETLALPLAISMANYIVIKRALSQTENQWFFLVMCGAALALFWRQQQRLLAERPQGVPLWPFPPRGPELAGQAPPPRPVVSRRGQGRPLVAINRSLPPPDGRAR